MTVYVMLRESGRMMKRESQDKVQLVYPISSIHYPLPDTSHDHFHHHIQPIKCGQNSMHAAAHEIQSDALTERS